MRLFVRSERTGDWHLHLYAVKQMLPYLHAAGHLHYAKSAHLYVQQVEELPAEIGILFAESDYFAIRRSDNFWARVWSNMTIEQVLMRAIKTSEGQYWRKRIVWQHCEEDCLTALLPVG